ncbi:hypothetical protein ACFMJ6_16155, partial [Acinetobacter baumannii]
MKKLALIAALSVVGIANAQAADGTITINGLVGNEVQYVVGMNPIALVITFLYFSIA